MSKENMQEANDIREKNLICTGRRIREKYIQVDIDIMREGFDIQVRLEMAENW